MTPSPHPPDASSFNYLSLFNSTPTPRERNQPHNKSNLNSFPHQLHPLTSAPSPSSSSNPLLHSSTKSVHFNDQPSFSPSIAPRRLFNQESNRETRLPLTDHTQVFSGQTLRYPILSAPHSEPRTQSNHSFSFSQSSLKPSTHKSGHGWVQELVDQPKPHFDHSSPFSSSNNINKLFGHFPATPHSVTASHINSSSLNPTSNSPATTTSNAFQKKASDSFRSQQPNSLLLAQQAQTPRSQGPTSKIPISLNPHLIGGMKLGQGRLMQRIRVNLISLVFLYTITSTKSFG